MLLDSYCEDSLSSGYLDIIQNGLKNDLSALIFTLMRIR